MCVGEVNGHHAAPSLLSRHLHAVHHALKGPEGTAYDVLNFDGGHILAPPAERVADAVAEGHVAEAVAHHQVARVEGLLP